MAASNQAPYFLMGPLVPNIVHGFKLATRTFVLSILEFIFIATSHKHCTFNISYARFGNLSLFASYAMLIRPTFSDPFDLRVELLKGSAVTIEQ